MFLWLLCLFFFFLFFPFLSCLWLSRASPWRGGLSCTEPAELSPPWRASIPAAKLPACSDRSGRAAPVAPETALPAHLTVCKATAPDGAVVCPSAAPPAACFPAVDFPGAEAATTRFSRPGGRCTSHKTFCRKRQKLLRLPPDNCPVPWLSLPHRKGPLRGETPKKWTAEGAFAPPGEQPVGPTT